jgi:four helix bundle protein
MTNYKTLDAWKLSMEIVKEIYTLTKKYPGDEKYSLVDQTKRAVLSIPCNIAEGMGRNHKKDTIQFLHISRGSGYEAETLLNVAVMTNIIDEETFNRVSKKIERNIKMINGLINYLEQKP